MRDVAVGGRSLYKGVTYGIVGERGVFGNKCDLCGVGRESMTET